MHLLAIISAFLLSNLIRIQGKQVQDSSTVYMDDSCPGIANTSSSLNLDKLCAVRSKCHEGVTGPVPKNVLQFNCFCDVLCVTYGDCCEDVADEARMKAPVVDKGTFVCVLESDASHLKVGADALYLINKCPEIYKDLEVRRKCEQGVTTSYNPYGSWPVTDHDGLLYHNMFCAQCHGVSDFMFWMIEVGCDKPPSEEISVNSQDAVQDLLHEMLDSEFCHIHFNPLDTTLNYRPCKQAINSCPAGWTDDTGCGIAAKCTEGRNSYVYDNWFFPARVYKNPYCAMCNSAVKIGCEDMPTAFTDCGFTDIYPLSFVLDLNTGSSRISGNNVGHVEGAAVNETVSEVKTCKQGEVYDYIFDVCRLLVCRDGYVIGNNDCIAENTASANLLGLNSDCPRMSLNASEFVILPNNSLYVNKSLDVYGPEVYVLDDVTNTALVCTNYSQNYTVTHYYFSRESKFSVIQAAVSVVGQIISIVGLSIQLLVYCILPKLRNLAGINLMCLSASLLVAQLLFLLGSSASSIYELCATLAIVTHFAFISSFAWMHIMAFDIWKTFAKSAAPSSRDNNKNKFKRYSLYGWGLPLLVTTIAITVNFVSPEDAVYRPAYGEMICWIQSRIGLAIFFATPVAAILVCNVTFYVLTVVSIYKITKLARTVTKQKSGQRQLWLYVKLTCIMGLTWVFGFVAAAFDNEVLWYFFIVVNSLQGAFICIAFVCTKQVLKLLRERFSYSAISRHPTSSSSDSKTRSTIVLTNMSQ